MSPVSCSQNSPNDPGRFPVQSCADCYMRSGVFMAWPETNRDFANCHTSNWAIDSHKKTENPPAIFLGILSLLPARINNYQ